MTNNDVLRSLRYLLNVRDLELVRILEQANYLVTPEEITAYLKRDDEEGYEPCPDEVLGYFLNGLVIYKRGKDESRPAPPIELPVRYNDVMKKLRVAFELKDTDVIALIEKSSNLKVSKSELSAFFRSRSHPNYRECGAQYLRAMLKGLTP